MASSESSRDPDELWLNISSTGDGGVPSEGSTAGTPRRLKDMDAPLGAPVRHVLSRINPRPAALRAENLRLRRELQRAEHLALTDALTGLANRRGWEHHIARELSRARRLERPLCLGLIDIDGFKAYNDSRGHLAADRLLVEIAAIWRSTIRDIDVMCRWGGDEFALLLPDCVLPNAREILGRLQARMPGKQTCSAVAVCWDRHETSEQILDRADRQLYQAKNRELVPRGL